MEYQQWCAPDYFETFCCYYEALVRAHSQPETQKNMTDEEAAVRIQSQYKGFKVRKEIQEKKESKAATRIQANFRGHKTRKQLAGPEGEEEEAFPNDGTDDCPGYSEEEAAAIKIQANFRGHKTRKQLAGKEEQ
ncbi:abnormal spindle-like microcephaly-associated protein homolog isoform X7 [Bolinopsis microptera]|uniref:abnormal spindle-like microcephaly-associated protein homolog isoform X7 n=1 Tax=Bolinopsis microptera TaxID=2820187 RepID=UPI003079B494